MDDFSDLLKFILPLVFFVGAAIFGKSNKQKAQPNNSGQSDFSPFLDLLGDETDMATMPHTIHYPEDEQRPQPYETTEPQQPEEGERAIVVESHEVAEPEPEKPGFDAREAVIYSTILERKY